MVESEIIPLVDDQYADARRLAQLGEVNTLVLLESLTRQQQAKVRLIEARQEEALAAIELAELAGPGPDAAFTNTPPPATEPGAAH
jgi:outer membrane protein TolC